MKDLRKITIHLQGTIIMSDIMATLVLLKFPFGHSIYTYLKSQLG